jgi:hypothetical protein
MRRPLARGAVLSCARLRPGRATARHRSTALLLYARRRARRAVPAGGARCVRRAAIGSSRPRCRGGRGVCLSAPPGWEPFFTPSITLQEPSSRIPMATDSSSMRTCSRDGRNGQDQAYRARLPRICRGRTVCRACGRPGHHRFRPAAGARRSATDATAPLRSAGSLRGAPSTAHHLHPARTPKD